MYILVTYVETLKFRPPYFHSISNSVSFALHTHVNNQKSLTKQITTVTTNVIKFQKLLNELLKQKTHATCNVTDNLLRIVQFKHINLLSIQNTILTDNFNIDKIAKQINRPFLTL